jgi:hypothetical protein
MFVVKNKKLLKVTFYKLLLHIGVHYIRTRQSIAVFPPSSYIFKTQNFLAKTIPISTSLAGGYKQIAKFFMWNLRVDLPRIFNNSCTMLRRLALLLGCGVTMLTSARLWTNPHPLVKSSIWYRSPNVTQATNAQ